MAPITLSDDHVEAALYAVEQGITYMTLAKRCVPRGVLEVRNILRLASSIGSETETAETDLDHDLIDSNEAAHILGCSRRWIWDIRADLEGRKYGGRWLFPRSHVQDYADFKHAAA